LSAATRRGISPALAASLASPTRTKPASVAHGARMSAQTQTVRRRRPQTVPESYSEPRRRCQSHIQSADRRRCQSHIQSRRPQTVPESYSEPQTQTVPESYSEQLFLLIAETQVCHDRFASFPRMPS
jgi:hypothetical protein